MTAITYTSAVADRGFVEFQLTPVCHLETLPSTCASHATIHG